MVCATSKASDQPDYSMIMIVKLLTENHLDFLSLLGGCTGSSESTLVKIPHCWKSHVAAQYYLCKKWFSYFFNVFVVLVNFVSYFYFLVDKYEPVV